MLLPVHTTLVFERYTEEARRCLFFARYEASQRGSPRIESEHLLLGIGKTHRGALDMFAHFRVDPATFVRSVDKRTLVGEYIALSREIPFSPEVKRILNGARHEADRLEHSHIGAEHLVLALLGESASVAGLILSEAGISADEARAYVANLSPQPVSQSATLTRDARVELIRALVDQLNRAERNSQEAQDLVARIHRALDGLSSGTVSDSNPRT